jgi:argininosuccinate lyase
VENTGRIKRRLTEPARRILFGEKVDDVLHTELRFISQVDKAHLVMLTEAGIIRREQACRILQFISELQQSNFKPLRNRVALRGTFLLYEDYLIQELGAETGGILHTGRSRNDLNATILRLRLRRAFLGLIGDALRLQAVLLRRACRFAHVLMPAYTHYQAAVPITYGHYLLGVVCAIERDIEGMWMVVSDLNGCPLGAGAVSGTTLAIRPARVAELLGFGHIFMNSVDAVASRDLILRLLSSASIFGVTLSRLAGDLLLWLTAEFNFLTLPDHLVGSSSMMPQKRNPFLLEHVQGRSAVVLGAFVSAASAMHAKPFTNSISVGTEAVAPVWGALESITQAALLARLVVAGATPNEAAMIRRAIEGYTTATEFANRLMTEGGLPFRSAHHIVGAIISDAVKRDAPSLEEAAERWMAEHGQEISLEGLDPASIVQATIFGGGPGPASFNECFGSLRERWTTQVLRKREQARKWREAETLLELAVSRLCAGVDAA